MAFNSFGMFGSQAPVFGGNFIPAAQPAPFHVTGGASPTFGGNLSFAPAYHPMGSQQAQGQGQQSPGIPLPNVNGIGNPLDNVAYAVRQPFLPSAQTSNILGDMPSVSASTASPISDLSSGLDLSSLAALFG